MLVFGIVPFGFAAFGLQRLLLKPADSVLFGPTLDGGLMFLVPTILIGFVLSMMAARPLTNWIRRGLSMPERVPFAWWAELVTQAMYWRFAGGLAGLILIAVGAKGLGSYFYLTESSVSVRPPLEFSMRHYQWKDVTTVSVRCRHSIIVKTKNRFRYLLTMSDGYEVDLSQALLGATSHLRAASAAHLAETISLCLYMVPSIRYEFDVSQDGLTSLDESHGVVLANALREQVLAHGGRLEFERRLNGS